MRSPIGTDIKYLPVLISISRRKDNIMIDIHVAAFLFRSLQRLFND